MHSLLISGATIIDGTAAGPIEGHSIWIEGSRIRAIGRRDDFGIRPAAKTLDARGKYIIPGLMNANVHLLGDVRLENLVRHYGHYEELILEAAQVALKNGLTTVFDTWGPRHFLRAVRDQVRSARAPGGRIFCAGNIIGFDGPFSHDFIAKATEVASPALVNRINAIWAENVGRHLMWLTPEQVSKEVRAYLGKGIDFIKYASNEHHGTSAGAFLAFSPSAQAAIVAEAHRAGATAQAHTMSVEGLRIAIEAGCDLIQHANITGPVPIPETTLELMVKRKTGAVVFPSTTRGLEWIIQNASDSIRTMLGASETNVSNLIRSGATLLLANDGAILAPEALKDPKFARIAAGTPQEDNLYSLATGHFVWFKAMEEKGCPPMEMLRAATRNIAVAYGKDRDLGTLEVGKIADALILDKDPLQAADNYRAIHIVIKDGVIVDRDALPLKRILTNPAEEVAEEQNAYVPFFGSGHTLPLCPVCISHSEQ